MMKETRLISHMPSTLSKGITVVSKLLNKSVEDSPQTIKQSIVYTYENIQIFNQRKQKKRKHNQSLMNPIIQQVQQSINIKSLKKSSQIRNISQNKLNKGKQNKTPLKQRKQQQLINHKNPGQHMNKNKFKCDVYLKQNDSEQKLKNNDWKVPPTKQWLDQELKNQAKRKQVEKLQKFLHQIRKTQYQVRRQKVRKVYEQMIIKQVSNSSRAQSFDKIKNPLIRQLQKRLSNIRKRKMEIMERQTIRS